MESKWGQLTYHLDHVEGFLQTGHTHNFPGTEFGVRVKHEVEYHESAYLLSFNRLVSKLNELSTEDELGQELAEQLAQMFHLTGCMVSSSREDGESIIGRVGLIERGKTAKETRIVWMSVLGKRVGCLYLEADRAELLDARALSFVQAIAGNAAAILSSMQLSQLKTHWEQTANRRVAEERKRISAELHDGPLQLLSHMMRVVDRGSRSLDREHDLQPFRELACQAAQELRATCQNLRPNMLEKMGLAVALSTLIDKANRYAEKTNFSVHFDPRVPEDLPDEWELVIFRSVQELLCNAYKHANATNVQASVEMDQQQKRLLIKVEDDGKGIQDPYLLEQCVHEGHLGLQGVRERVRMIGGEMELCTDRAIGLGIVLQIPMIGGHSDE